MVSSFHYNAEIARGVSVSGSSEKLRLSAFQCILQQLSMTIRSEVVAILKQVQTPQLRSVFA